MFSGESGTHSQAFLALFLTPKLSVSVCLRVILCECRHSAEINALLIEKEKESRAAYSSGWNNAESAARSGLHRVAHSTLSPAVSAVLTPAKPSEPTAVRTAC